MASEFLLWEQVEGGATSPLKKANTETSLNQNTFPELWKTADELKIDQLSLDNLLVAIDQKDNGSLDLLVSVGNYLVKRPLPKQAPKKLNKTISDTIQQLWDSPFGTLERHKQWASLLKATKNAYDIVVVYAENQHFENTYYQDLQPMLQDEPKYMYISLFDVNPASYAKVIQEREENKNSETSQKMDQLIQTSFTNMEDFSKPVWALIDGGFTPSENKAFPQAYYNHSQMIIYLLDKSFQ